jgi:FtsP/CotA-like multicopper oxidase with cupredoxin domain
MNHIVSRRALLSAGLGVAGSAALAACSGEGGSSSGSGRISASRNASLVSPSGPQVSAAEAKRTGTGRTVSVNLTAVAATVDLGGAMVDTWSFGGALPAAPIRISAGDTLHAQVVNHLPAETSAHWHGIALRNDMDGVPPVTQRAIAPGSAFGYRFIAENPGTYWFHPHVGVQLDRGLYGALIVEDPKEPLSYDDEWVVILDDWLDGVNATTPDAEYIALTKPMNGTSASASASAPASASASPMAGMTGMGSMDGMDMNSPSASATTSASSSSPASMAGMPGMGSVGTSPLLGGDAGDVAYPYHLVNGRIPANPDVHTGKPGERVRLRIINAGSDTAYRVALGGHRLTLTHTDGYPINHQSVDAVLIAPGERYDALVTLGAGVFPLVALAEGKNALGRALVRTGPGSTPGADVRPSELNGMLMTATGLTSAADVRLVSKKVARTHRIELTGSMGTYNWSLNGIEFDTKNPTAHPYLISQGERVRLEFVNTTTMWHPMHLHGHTFQLGASGPRKDTVIVLPGQTVSCDFDADNPGQWMVHCHNAYHGEAGMMGLLGYSA